MKKRLLYFLAFLSVVVLSLLITGRWRAVGWMLAGKGEIFRKTNANVSLNGQPFPASVFRHRSGKILFVAKEFPTSPEIFLPEFNLVLACNRDTFYDFGLIGIQRRDGGYPCVDPGKREVAQMVRFDGHKLVIEEAPFSDPTSKSSLVLNW